MDGAEITCEEIVEEDQKICECADCVREVKFKYTGKTCSDDLKASGSCTDVSPLPFTAGYRITDCDDATKVLATGQAEQNDEVTVAVADGSCLPACMDVTLSAAVSGAVAQTFKIDAQCGGGRGLVLSSDYGGFESRGYSCSETDTHNCDQEITYGIKFCNVGSTDEKIYDWSMVIDDVEVDLLERLTDDEIMLSPDEGCLYETETVVVDRCVETQSCTVMTANVTDPATGLPAPCSETHEIKFGWDVITAPPSPEPSPRPSDQCIIDIKLDQCPAPPNGFNNDCSGRPMTIVYRLNGGDCSNSQRFQPRQKFACEDFGSSVSLVEGTPYFIRATASGKDDVYFEGPVSVGDIYTLNEDLAFNKLSADMTIEIFDSEGGTLVQQTTMHLSCSQPLFVFDQFGASQVRQFTQTDGTVISDAFIVTFTDTNPIGLTLRADAASGPIEITEMNLIYAAGEPEDLTSQVAGQILQPGGTAINVVPEIEITYDLQFRRTYNYFVTVVGKTAEGTTCNGNDFLECDVGLNLLPDPPTDVPTPKPTITAYPTSDPESTSCEVRTEISCEVTNIPFVRCDDVVAQSSSTCPATDDIYLAHMRYDGSQGDSVFVEITCDKSTYFDRSVASGELFYINTRGAVSNSECQSVEVNVYTADYEINENNAEFISSTTVNLLCPGPWTLGTKIAGMFDLEAFVTTPDEGFNNNLYIQEAVVEISYFALNNGQYPLSINNGFISQVTSSPTSTSGEGAIGLNGLPIALGARSPRQLLETTTSLIMVVGQAGSVTTFGLEVEAVTSNQFALPCDDTTNYAISL